MKQLAVILFLGKDNAFSGVIALGFVAVIALGCTCGKNFDFANLGKNDDSARSSSNDSTTATPIKAAKADASTGEVPADDQLQELVRATILDFNDAIQSGDFAEFHSKVSKPFQKSATPEKFEEGFAIFITTKPDFSQVSSLDADFTSTSIERMGGLKALKASGVYQTSPRPMKFELKYLPEGKDWKLIAIEINTRD